MKPQLDFQFGPGYSGLKDGMRPDQYILPTIDGVHGVDAIGGIRYQVPNGEQSGRGERSAGPIDRAAGRLPQPGERAEHRIGCHRHRGGVRNAALQLERVNRSVAFFRTALDNEREKYRLGVGSLVEVLTVEDRLTGVLVAQVQAELGYAVALARLRQGTGTTWSRIRRFNASIHRSFSPCRI